MEKYIVLAIIFINAISYLFFRKDKLNAKRGKWRISESVLLTTIFLGGTFGGILSMKVYHHKTRKASFILKMVFIIALQLSLIYIIYDIIA